VVINWSVIEKIASPIIGVVVGIALNWFFERRPRLIAYFNHASAFNVPGANSTAIRTHGVVIKNIGKRPATDIRVRHHVLPEHLNIFPDIERQIQSLPGGSSEIVFPVLVQNEQVTISYLYFPPLFANQIHASIRHSDGFAEEVTALPTPRYSPWIRRGLWVLLVVGMIASVYVIFEGLSFIPGILRALIRLKRG